MSIHNWAGKKVLIVDDAKIVRHAAKKIYTSAGLLLAGEASNGEEALAMLKDAWVDLIHLDVIMPEMNGLDCLRVILQMHAEARVVVSSCLLDDKQVVARLQKEFPSVVFQAKPFTYSALESALKTWEVEPAYLQSA